MGDLAARAAVDAETAGRIGTDPAALEKFYRAHYDDVVRYFARRVTYPHEVADLVAETFLTVVECAGRFDPGRGRQIAWLFGIAHHVFKTAPISSEAVQIQSIPIAGPTPDCIRAAPQPPPADTGTGSAPDPTPTS